jgi:hypothetical protein
MTGREMIVALLAYDLDAPLWVGKGMGPAGGIEPFTNPAGETTLVIKPVTP